MISSPVERMATRGRRTTFTSPRPIAARTPVSRADRRVPFLRTSSPRAMSVPAKVTPAPGATGRRTRISASSRSPSWAIVVCSTMTTASAPRGSMLPVAIKVAGPGGIALEVGGDDDEAVGAGGAREDRGAADGQGFDLTVLDPHPRVIDATDDRGELPGEGGHEGAMGPFERAPALPAEDRPGEEV